MSETLDEFVRLSKKVHDQQQTIIAKDREIEEAKEGTTKKNKEILKLMSGRLQAQLKVTTLEKELKHTTSKCNSLLRESAKEFGDLFDENKKLKEKLKKKK